MSLTKEQLALRRTGITGTDIPALVGMSPFRTPLDVWLSKVEGAEAESSEDMERGEFLEDGVARWYAHRTGAAVEQVGTIVHPKNNLVVCTPDRIAKLNGERDLSIKVPGPYSREWGEAGTDDAPQYAIIQLQWELVALRELRGIEAGDIAALIGGRLSIYPVAADAELQGMLLEAAAKFWRDYVQTGTPPPVDGSESYSEFLKDKARTVGALKPAPLEAEYWAKQLKEAQAQLAKWGETEDLARNQLKALCGDARGLCGAGWSAAWSPMKGCIVERKPTKTFRVNFKER